MMGQVHRLTPTDPAVVAINTRQRGDLSRNLDALIKGESTGRAVGVMIEKLKDMLGNPDLSEVLDGVESIYSVDDTDAHFSAAHVLRNATREALLDHDIE